MGCESLHSPWTHLCGLREGPAASQAPGATGMPGLLHVCGQGISQSEVGKRPHSTGLCKSDWSWNKWPLAPETRGEGERQEDLKWHRSSDMITTISRSLRARTLDLTAWIQILALLLTSHVTLKMPLNISGGHYLHLKNENYKGVCFVSLL